MDVHTSIRVFLILSSKTGGAPAKVRNWALSVTSLSLVRIGRRMYGCTHECGNLCLSKCGVAGNVRVLTR